MDRREKEKAQARKATAQEWAEESNRSWEPTTINYPEGKPEWKPDKAGLYRLDVIPYLAGKGNKHADEGMEYFQRTYAQHRGLGLEGKSSYLCPAFCFKKRCYVCEWINSEGATNKKLADKLRAQDRFLMNVIDVTTEESRKKGIQVMNQPFGTSKHPSFGQMLKNKISTLPDELKLFWEREAGYTLHCKVEEDTWPGGKYFKITNVEMVKRKKDYDKDIMEETVCLDECLIEKTYDQLKKIFNQEPDEPERPEDDTTVEDQAANGAETEEEDEEEKEPDTRNGEASGKKKKNAEQLGLKKNDVVWYKHKGEKLKCDITRISPDGTTLTLEGPDGDEYKGVAPDEVSKHKVEEAVEEDEKPQSRKPAPKDEEEDADFEELDEEDEEDDEEEPQRKKTGKK